MSSMSDRKAELERKKAKLQMLREEKDRRRREKEQKDAEEALVSDYLVCLGIYCASHRLEVAFKQNL